MTLRHFACWLWLGGYLTAPRQPPRPRGDYLAAHHLPAMAWRMLYCSTPTTEVVTTCCGVHVSPGGIRLRFKIFRAHV